MRGGCQRGFCSAFSIGTSFFMRTSFCSPFRYYPMPSQTHYASLVYLLRHSSFLPGSRGEKLLDAALSRRGARGFTVAPAARLRRAATRGSSSDYRQPPSSTASPAIV